MTEMNQVCCGYVVLTSRPPRRPCRERKKAGSSFESIVIQVMIYPKRENVIVILSIVHFITLNTTNVNLLEEKSKFHVRPS